MTKPPMAWYQNLDHDQRRHHWRACVCVCACVCVVYATYEVLKGMLPKDHVGVLAKLYVSTKVNTPPCFSSVLPMRTW